MAHLCDRHTAVLIVSTHFVSIRSLSIGADGYGRHVPAIIDMLVQLPLQQSEQLGNGVGIIRVDHCLCYLPGARIV